MTWICMLLASILVFNGVSARFVVEKNNIRVVSPLSLRGKHDGSIGNFGIPDYGGFIIGSVVYPEKGANGCESFDGQSFKSKSSRPSVVLLDRGECGELVRKKSSSRIFSGWKQEITTEDKTAIDRMAIRNMSKIFKWNKFISSKPSSSFSTTIPNLSNTYLNTKPQKPPTLSPEELRKINLLIPRLCLSNHLETALQLTTTALTLPKLPPNPKSLSLSILIHSFTLQPDLKLPMSLLTRLTRMPQTHPYLKPITTMLVASYLKKGRPKDALKVYKWMVRPGSSCDSMVDKSAYGILVGGLCGNGLVLEGLMVLKDMLRAHLLPGEGLKKRVIRSLLREARVREAKALDQLLPCIGFAGDINKVLDLLDHLIGNWSD